MQTKNKMQALQIIQQVDSYKTSFQPLLSERKKSAIEQKLKLEKEATQHTRERQIELQYYIKYNYNPFIQLRAQQVQPISRTRDEPVVNIIDKMVHLKQKVPEIKPFIQQKSININNLKTDQQLVSQKMINNIHKSRSMAKFDHPLRIKKQQLIKYQPTVSKHNQTEDMLKNQDIQIIASVKQQNFFVHNKKINIFKIAKGDDDQISNKQTLQKYYFCNNSMVQKIAKIKLPIYRQLSRMARQNITGQRTKENIIDYVDSYEMSYKINQLLFHDLMSLANNRFSPDFLNNILNFQQANNNKQNSDTSSLQEEDDKSFNIFRKNQNHAQDNFVNPNQQIQQIKDYKKLDTNTSEQKHEKRYQKQKEYVHRQIQLKKDLKKNAVKDSILHKEIGKSVEESLTRLINLDEKKMDVDRLVRINKATKNRNQTLKIKTLLETLANKNKNQQMDQQPSRSANKKKIKK